MDNVPLLNKTNQNSIIEYMLRYIDVTDMVEFDDNGWNRA